jgi:hypothetical protein
MPVPNPKVVLTLSIDARQAAAFLDARFDLVSLSPNVWSANRKLAGNSILGG